MDTVVILSLTVALAAAVVWWVTAGELPSFGMRRRGFDPASVPPVSGGADTVLARKREAGVLMGAETGVMREADVDVEAPGAGGRPAPHLVPGLTRAERRGAQYTLPEHPFGYGDAAPDERPPRLLTFLRIVFAIALVGALLAGGAWAAGQFVTSLMARLLGQ